MSLNNPLLDFSNHPLFDAIQPAHIAPALDQLLPAADAALEQVTAADFPAEWKAIAAVLDVAISWAVKAAPAMAALAGALVPSRNNLPPAVVLPDKIVHNSGRTIPGQFAGLLGQRYDPWFLEVSPYHPLHYGAFPEYLFHHEKGRVSDENLSFHSPELSLPQGLTLDRMLDRVSLRDTIERQSRALSDAADDGQLDRYREAAVSLLANTGVHDAFDLTHADPRQLDRYGRNSFGWSLLMAKNLVQSGVRLVQVNLGNNETWDTHQAAWPNLKNFLLPPMDQAVSALIEDLDASGQLDETLIVMGGEFGRTPHSQGDDGRDHNNKGFSMWMAGGGVKGGMNYGMTDDYGYEAVLNKMHIHDWHATVLALLGLDHERLTFRYAGRDFRLTDVYGTVAKEIIA